MWATLKAAWMALSAFKNAKAYLVMGLVAALLLGGANAVYTSQAKTISKQAETIQAAGERLGEKQQDNELLQQSLSAAKNGRTEAENKLKALNDAQLSNAKELEKVKRENEELQRKMRDAQENDPGANSRIPDDVKRMHEQAVREFNEKYGSGGGTPQAGDPASTDVRHSKRLAC